MSEHLIRNKIKDNSRRKNMPAQWKAQRRKEAEERQAAYDKLTIDQKIDKLNAGGFAATKQRKKLYAQKENQK